MRYLVKNSDNSLSIISVVSSIPSGLDILQEIDDNFNASQLHLLEVIDGQVVNSLSKARSSKLQDIRNKRDAKLLENDKAWLIAAKKKEDTSAIEAEAQMLRDLPTVASAHLDTLQTLEEINNYNPIGA